MQQFRISQATFNESRKKNLIKVVPTLLISLIVGITITEFNSSKGTDINVLLFVIPVSLIALGIGVYRGLNRQKAILESYVLTVGESFITREQLNTPVIKIETSEVKQINKFHDGSFTLQGTTPSDLIIITRQIENYEQLESILTGLMPLTERTKQSVIEKFQSFTSLVTVGLMLCVFTVDNKVIVGLTGSALILIILWSFDQVRRSKNVDSKTKKNMWWLLLVLVSVVLVLIFKLSGFARP